MDADAHAPVEEWAPELDDPAQEARDVAAYAERQAHDAKVKAMRQRHKARADAEAAEAAARAEALAADDYADWRADMRGRAERRGPFALAVWILCDRLGCTHAGLATALEVDRGSLAAMVRGRRAVPSSLAARVAALASDASADSELRDRLPVRGRPSRDAAMSPAEVRTWALHWGLYRDKHKSKGWRALAHIMGASDSNVRGWLAGGEYAPPVGEDHAEALAQFDGCLLWYRWRDRRGEYRPRPLYGLNGFEGGTFDASDPTTWPPAFRIARGAFDYRAVRSIRDDMAPTLQSYGFALRQFAEARQARDDYLGDTARDYAAARQECEALRAACLDRLAPYLPS